MLKRALLTAALAALPSLATAPLAAQNERVYVRTPGPGEATAVLQDILSRPYAVRHERWNTRLFRDSVFDRSVVVVGSDATVASTVHGDVVVVGGDLFLRPGAEVDGRAVAIGGGVYRSEQARVHGAELSFRDTRFDVARTPEGTALDYRRPEPLEQREVLSLPIPYGIRVPTYSRVEGLALSWGPRVALADGRLVIDPTVTYRSDIGAFDPAASVSFRTESGWSVEGSAGRGTFTNDAWIESDIANSLSTLVAGHDYRNYWRADRVDGRLARVWEGSDGQLSLWAGARTERDWSIAAGGPWSIGGQTSTNGIIRPNPEVEHGRLSSALAGATGELQLAQLTVRGDLTVERPFDAPRDERFTQTTLDGTVEFPTFSTQTFRFRTHVVYTAGDTAPPQRFAYLGGSGTLPTLGILELGGDRLAFFEGRYNIPIDAVHVPVLGPPVVSLRYMLGSVGVQRFPAFRQNLGVRLALGPGRLDFTIDPDTHRHSWGAGLAIMR